MFRRWNLPQDCRFVADVRRRCSGVTHGVRDMAAKLRKLEASESNFALFLNFAPLNYKKEQVMVAGGRGGGEAWAGGWGLLGKNIFCTAYLRNVIRGGKVKYIREYSVNIRGQSRLEWVGCLLGDFILLLL